MLNVNVNICKMLKQKFIKNYSSVIIDEQSDNIDDFYKECLIWEKVLSANSLVFEKIYSKVISAEKKISLFEGLFDFAKITYKYFLFLIQQNKSEYWERVIKCCIREYKRIKRIGTADIVSAFPLDDVNKTKLCSFLKKKFKLNDVEISNSIDESIINGVIIYLDNFRIDLSLRKIFI